MALENRYIFFTKFLGILIRNDTNVSNLIVTLVDILEGRSEAKQIHLTQFIAWGHSKL